jgi:E3 ubiquitin-protein ligase SIAH1
MVPPILLCTNGHNICSKCAEGVQRCPTCRAQILETRNVAVENIARRLKYPCVNRPKGCLDLFSIEHIAEHQAFCVYGKIKCPFQITGACSWNGLESNLKEHAKVAHPGNVWHCSTLFSLDLLETLGILSCFGALFTYYQRIKDGRLYGAVQLIGTSSEASKYKCEFTLRAANGIEQISKTFFVRSYSEDFETIFNSLKCLCLDEALVRNFLEEDNLNLMVKLSRVY